MNNQFQVTSVSKVLVDKNGRQIVIIAINSNKRQDNGAKANIVLSLNHFQASIDEYEFTTHGQARRAFKGSTVTGDIVFSKKGSTYILNEHSKAVKAGTAQVGDTATRNSSGFMVQGILDFELSEVKDFTFERVSAYKSSLANIAAMANDFGAAEVEPKDDGNELTADSYASLSKDDLKDLAKANNISSTGNEAAIIARLIDAEIAPVEVTFED